MSDPDPDSYQPRRQNSPATGRTLARTQHAYAREQERLRNQPAPGAQTVPGSGVLSATTPPSLQNNLYARPGLAAQMQPTLRPAAAADTTRRKAAANPQGSDLQSAAIQGQLDAASDMRLNGEVASAQATGAPTMTPYGTIQVTGMKTAQPQQMTAAAESGAGRFAGIKSGSQAQTAAAPLRWDQTAAKAHPALADANSPMYKAYMADRTERKTKAGAQPFDDLAHANDFAENWYAANPPGQPGQPGQPGGATPASDDVTAGAASGAASGMTTGALKPKGAPTAPATAQTPPGAGSAEQTKLDPFSQPTDYEAEGRQSRFDTELQKRKDSIDAEGAAKRGDVEAIDNEQKMVQDNAAADTQKDIEDVSQMQESAGQWDSSKETGTRLDAVADGQAARKGNLETAFAADDALDEVKREKLGLDPYSMPAKPGSQPAQPQIAPAAPTGPVPYVEGQPKPPSTETQGWYLSYDPSGKPKEWLPETIRGNPFKDTYNWVVDKTFPEVPDRPGVKGRPRIKPI